MLVPWLKDLGMSATEIEILRVTVITVGLFALVIWTGWKLLVSPKEDESCDT